MLEDTELLRRFAADRDEAAFAEFVHRRIDFVYAAALRQVHGDTHRAEDVAQAVFVDAARNAAKLASHPVVGGWLHTATRFAAAKILRAEQRRQRHEREANAMQELLGKPEPMLEWSQLQPVLDAALAELKPRERDAILLRFFEGFAFAEIGAKLSLTETAARSCVDRALNKLRGLLARRGIESTTVAISTALLSQPVLAAPVGLATSVTGAAVATGGSGASAVAITFISMTKLQIGIAGVVALAGGAGFWIEGDAHARLRQELAMLRVLPERTAMLRQQNQAYLDAAKTAAEWRDLAQALPELKKQAADLRARPSLPDASAIVVSTLPPIVGDVFEPKQLDRQPQPVSQPVPIYPKEFRHSGVGGEVVVEFVVDSEGRVRNARALRSTGQQWEQAALEAVSLWQYQPGAIGEKAVNARLRMPMVFKMENPDGAPAASAPVPRMTPALWF
jgi:RNA polymerase sigma factor (sigma-70 family)